MALEPAHVCQRQQAGHMTATNNDLYQPNLNLAETGPSKHDIALACSRQGGMPDRLYRAA